MAEEADDSNPEEGTLQYSQNSHKIILHNINNPIVCSVIISSRPFNFYTIYIYI